MSRVELAKAIHVRNLQRTVAVDVARLVSFANRALKSVGQQKGTPESVLGGLDEVFVVLVSDRKIAELHRRFMGIAGPTDVITFQHGEIVISVETAARHAQEFGEDLHREIERYIVHGLLHLHGFDDQTSAASRRMLALQEKLLKACTRAP